MGISYSRRYSVPVYLWTTTSVLLRRRPLLGRAVSILLLLLLAELVTRSDVSDMLAARITRVLLAEYCYAVVVTHNTPPLLNQGTPGPCRGIVLGYLLLLAG